MGVNTGNGTLVQNVLQRINFKKCDVQYFMDGYCREGNLRAALNEKGRIKDFCSKGKLEGANGFSMRYWIWVWCQIEQLLNR